MTIILDINALQIMHKLCVSSFVTEKFVLSK